MRPTTNYGQYFGELKFMYFLNVNRKCNRNVNKKRKEKSNQISHNVASCIRLIFYNKNDSFKNLKPKSFFIL